MSLHKNVLMFTAIGLQFDTGKSRVIVKGFAKKKKEGK